MSDCDGMMHPRAKAGISLFNQGRYFEAHEELEAAWRAEPGKVRELYQGILEAGVTYLHLLRGNYPGALKVYERSMRWLRSWPESCRGVCVGQLRSDMEAAIVEARRLGEARISQFETRFLRPIVWKEG